MSEEALKQVLTIGEAKNLYAKFGLSLYSDDVDLAELVRHSDWSTGLTNSNYLHALALTDVMFRETKTSLAMLTGPECEYFLECLSKTFEAALERVKAASGAARLIMIGDNDASRRDRLRGKYGNQLQVAFGMPSQPNILADHYLICDARMVRHEEPHDKILDTDDAGKIKARVFFNSPIMAKVLGARFDSLWNLLSS